MEQYIPKSSLVAEIEKLNTPFYPTLAEKMAYQDATKDCIDIIYTLEVKEVDLCKEEERIWKDFNIGECHLSKNDLEKISKHFFELGLNTAQKGE